MLAEVSDAAGHANASATSAWRSSTRRGEFTLVRLTFKWSGIASGQHETTRRVAIVPGAPSEIDRHVVLSGAHQVQARILTDARGPRGGNAPSFIATQFKDTPVALEQISDAWR